MKKLFPVFGFFLAMIAANSASAQTGVIGDDHVGCLTDRYYENYDIAVMSKNWKQRDDLMAYACYEIEDLEYSLLKKSYVSARIQVTIDGEALRLTTSLKAIQ